MRKTFTLVDLARYSCEVNDHLHRMASRTLKRQGPSVLAVRNVLQYSKALAVSEKSDGGQLFMLMN